MITITILPADLHNGAKHIASEFQVATDEYFNNIVAHVPYEETYLYTKVMSLEIDLEQTYYTRARAILDTGGYTEWSEIEEVHPSEEKILSITTPMPSVIEAPHMNGPEGVDLNNVPNAPLTITLDAFTAIDTVDHKSTDWLLEDINGVILHDSINDTENLLSYTFDYAFKYNTLYHAKVAFRGTNENVSQFTSMSFVIGGE